MPNKNVTTLKQLAKELGYSISTISRALNDHPDISIKTKEKIKQLALKKHYAPNIFAKGFRLQKTNIIGLIVPSISHYFTSTLIQGALNEADKLGYKIIVAESKNEELKQIEMLNTMCHFGVDGILLSLTSTTNNIESILEILKMKPLVLFDKVSSNIPCTQVVIDDESASFRIVDHIISTGKKRIALIKGRENSFISEKRYLGYLSALKTHNIELDEDLIINAQEISVYGGQKTAEKLLKLANPPDAIFTITDNLAIGVIQKLKSKNIKIPDQVAVAGFSNSFGCEIIEPNLTTVDQPGLKIGGVAVKYLIDEINNPNTLEKQVSVQINTNIIIRNSTFSILE